MNMIVSTNSSGLCNRIKSLMSTMKLAEYYNTEAKVLWHSRKGVINCNFSDLFENFDLEINQIPNGANCYNLWRFAVTPDDKIPNNFFRGGVRHINKNQIFDGFSHTSVDGRNIDLEFDRIPQETINSYLKHLHKLKIKKDILYKVDEFSNTFDDNTVSVQIRSWVDDTSKQKYFNIDDFCLVMDNFKDSNFYVTADTPEIIEILKNKYGDRILYRKTLVELGDRDSKDGIVDAMIDLLLLSRNKTLIGTYISTFTELAWWFSDCKSKVIIP